MSRLINKARTRRTLREIYIDSPDKENRHDLRSKMGAWREGRGK